ncbi:MAG: methyltransferase domain-containing protein, partial [Solirubrobacterales bacterium]
MESGQQTGEGPGGQDEEIRAGMRAMWGLVASGWEENADFVDRSGADMTAAMLAAANLKSGERVLELACGPGGVGMAAAEQVGPDGEVVLSDVAPEMTAIAASRANENGLTNVTTQELDLEQIDQ